MSDAVLRHAMERLSAIAEEQRRLAAEEDELREFLRSYAAIAAKAGVARPLEGEPVLVRARKADVEDVAEKLILASPHRQTTTGEVTEALQLRGLELSIGKDASSRVSAYLSSGKKICRHPSGKGWGLKPPRSVNE